MFVFLAKSARVFCNLCSKIPPPTWQTCCFNKCYVFRSDGDFVHSFFVLPLGFNLASSSLLYFACFSDPCPPNPLISDVLVKSGLASRNHLGFAPFAGMSACVPVVCP